jgi:hypothetical protein
MRTEQCAESTEIPKNTVYGKIRVVQHDRQSDFPIVGQAQTGAPNLKLKNRRGKRFVCDICVVEDKPREKLILSIINIISINTTTSIIVLLQVLDDHRSTSASTTSLCKLHDSSTNCR